MSEPTNSHARPADSGEAPQKARRRFLGVGAGAAPAVLMLTSQPALGTTCFTPSRSLSRNTSVSQAGKFGTCTGRPPSHYFGSVAPHSARNWPGAPVASHPFHPLFAGNKFVGTTSPTTTRSLTLLEVLRLPTTGTLPSGVSSIPATSADRVLASRLVAAYLNVQHGFVPAVVADSARILTIWAEYSSRTYYEATAGVRWYQADILAYLQSNNLAPAA